MSTGRFFPSGRTSGADWAGGRPFAWVDDEITDADRDWVQANHHGRALLWHAEPFRGLTGKDFATLDQWLRAA
jgi:hypothetical protein